MIPLIRDTYSSQIHKARKQIEGCQGLRGGENKQSLFNGCRFSIWDDKKVLEMDASDGCTTM